MKRFTLPALLLAVLLLAGCRQIWNASDLVDWVREQAVAAGCDPATIELADWYVQQDGANVWPGSCVNAQTGARMELAIGIDRVWKPSEVSPATPAAGDESAAAPAIPLTADALQNTTYSGIYDELVTLTAGRYEGEPFVAGDASRPTVEYLDQATLFGDLNGDGAEDAVVFLVESGGGTGNFVYMAAQLNQDGQPIAAGAMLIEDRIQVKSATVQAGQILLEVIGPGPGDGACCPSYKMSKAYTLHDGLLAEVPAGSGEPVKTSGTDLDQTAWVLVEFGKGQPAQADAEVTLRFDGDQISGSGGCNDYNAGFTLGADNPFVMTVSPVAATQMACPGPGADQESAYFAALPKVSQWGYWFGKLALYYLDDDGTLARLLFAPAAAAQAG